MENGVNQNDVFRPDETFQSSVKGVTLNKFYSEGFKPVLRIWIRIQLDPDFLAHPDLDPGKYWIWIWILYPQKGYTPNLLTSQTADT